MDKKKTLDDIFNDDEFGILDTKPTHSNHKTEDDRLIESFHEINSFFEKNNREPEATSVTEFKLFSRLKALRNDPKKTEILKPYDTYNLLNTKLEVKTVADILSDDDLGILETEESSSIFNLKNVSRSDERAEADFVAKRTALKDKEFLPYDALFKKVHADLRAGKRKLFTYENADKNLKAGSYYILNGVLLFLEEANIETDNITLPSGNRLRKDGRTRIIFENGTMSNMLYRSLDKALLNGSNDGKIVSRTETEIDKELFNNVNSLNEEDLETGWVYILKSKSENPEIANIIDLYKIGFSKVKVEERIKNASKEPTYLNADVKIVATYQCYNLNPQKFENLLHRFFSGVCLNVDIYDELGQRITPREWFVAPFGIIEKAIHLILSGEIVKYNYDVEKQALVMKN